VKHRRLGCALSATQHKAPAVPRATLSYRMNSHISPRDIVMPKKRTKLPIVKSTQQEIVLTLGATPAFTGQDHEDLLCGSCDVVIGEGVSERAIAELFGAQPLIAKCKCGALNRLPAQA
jgi:hypothetical protein